MVISFGIRIMLFSLCLVSVGIREAFAGGYAIPPQTAKAASLANAVTAGVDNPSAIYVNPAGLTEVEGNEIMLGFNYVNSVSSVTNSGKRSVNRHDDSWIPSLFANYHIPATNLTTGIGLYTPFGLATTYDDGSFTRFGAIRSELRTFYLTPGIAWRPSSYLSLGAGISFVHSSALLSRGIFLGAVGVGEGRLRITDTDNSYGYNLGVLLKPHEQVKLGLTYRSRVDLDFDTADVKFLDAAIAGGASTRARAKGIHVPLPPVISMGIHWQIHPAWAVEFVYDFTRWSEFESLRGRFNPALPALAGLLLLPGFVVPENWKDTSSLRFGISYKLQENIELRGGIAVDETPVPGRTLSPAIPGADWLTLTGGIGYTWNKVTIDLGYMAVFYKTRRVTNNVLEGNPLLPFPGAPGRDKYETFQNLVLLHFRYRF